MITKTQGVSINVSWGGEGWGGLGKPSITFIFTNRFPYFKVFNAAGP